MSSSSARLVVVSLLVVAGATACGSSDSGGAGGTGGTGGADETTSITQHDITWVLAGSVQYGTFANGDYWVVGPVTILDTLPEVQTELYDLGNDICVGDYTSRDCSAACDTQYPDTAALCSEGSEPNSAGACWCLFGRNGWQSNPKAGRVTSGFDSRVGDQAFDSRLIPTLPYVAQPGESLVKGTSKEEGLADPRPSLRTASVLTVLAEPPPDGGATVFRPPYVGTDKPLYRVDTLHTEKLPSLPPLAEMPSWEEVESLVKNVQLEHIAGEPGVIIRPEENLYYYAPENGGRRAVVALRLMIDEPLENRMPALIYFVQGGIDMMHALKEGQTWGAGGGEYPGMKLIMLYAATMLDEQAFVTLVSNFFAYEDESVVYGVNNQALWGHIDGYHPQEEAYWSDVVNELLPNAEPSRKTLRDPYGYIDGGITPGTGYQICCSIQSFKGTSLVMQLMPELKGPWNLPALHDYVDRMVAHGTLTQPDPCAPPDAADIAAGIPIDDPASHYGITFGPDGAGGCIADTDASDGIGRFPAQDGVEQNPQGYHGNSPFIHAMWDAYRAGAD